MGGCLKRSLWRICTGTVWWPGLVLHLWAGGAEEEQPSHSPEANTSGKEGINAPGSSGMEAEEPLAASSCLPQREIRVARIISGGTCSQEVKNPLIKLLPCAVEAHKEPPPGRQSSVLHKSCMATSSAREAQRQSANCAEGLLPAGGGCSTHMALLLGLNVICLYLPPYVLFLHLREGAGTFH